MGWMNDLIRYTSSGKYNVVYKGDKLKKPLMEKSSSMEFFVAKILDEYLSNWFLYI